MKKITTTLFLAAISISSTTFAAPPGFYGDIGVGVGFGPDNTVVASALFPTSGGTLSANPNDVYTLRTRGMITSFFNLGYDITPHFGIEGDITYWGKQELTSFANNITPLTGKWNGELTNFSYGLNVVGYLPVSNSNLNLFAKLGIAGMHSEFTVNDPNGSIFFNPGSYRTTTNEPAVVYGAGAFYQFHEHAAAQLEWKGISRFDDITFSNLSYNLIGLGLRFNY